MPKNEKVKQNLHFLKWTFCGLYENTLLIKILFVQVFYLGVLFC